MLSVLPGAFLQGSCSSTNVLHDIQDIVLDTTKGQEVPGNGEVQLDAIAFLDPNVSAPLYSFGRRPLTSKRLMTGDRDCHHTNLLGECIWDPTHGVQVKYPAGYPSHRLRAYLKSGPVEFSLIMTPSTIIECNGYAEIRGREGRWFYNAVGFCYSYFENGNYYLWYGHESTSVSTERNPAPTILDRPVVYGRCFTIRPGATTWSFKTIASREAALPYPTAGSRAFRAAVSRLRLQLDAKPWQRWGAFPVRPPSYGWLQSSVLARLRSHIQGKLIDLRPLDQDMVLMLGDATQRAADAALAFEGNTAMYLNELRTIKEGVLDLVDLLRGDVDLRSISNLILSGKYGLRLTVQDTVDLCRSLNREIQQPQQAFSRVRGRVNHTFRYLGTDYQAAYGCKIYYDPRPGGLKQALNELMRWDLFPSLDNVWDLVPYSFVIDWFVHLGDFFSAVDSRTFISTLEIIRVLYTTRYSCAVDASLLSPELTGSCQLVYFDRWLQREAELPIPRFQGVTPPGHLVELAALIIQRS